MFSKTSAVSVFLSLPLLGSTMPLSFTQSLTHNSAARRQVNATSGSGKTWTLTDQYEGANFFDQWDFFSAADPTHGLVNYLPQDQAMSKGLANASDSLVTLSVDSTTKVTSGQNRDSVRISSKKTYNGGLFIADFEAMPVGCGTWPAYWSVGPNWPNGGEIDVMEGVHESTNNQITMHTSAGCTLDKSPTITGSVIGTTCESSGANNAGCATSDTTASGFGQSFNSAGGGVMAHLWDNDVGIKVWHFGRNNIPQDITARTPNPDSWGTPVSFLPNGNQCNVASHFQSHSLTINTALCGDWAGSSYKQGNGCAAATCADAVADPSNFVDAIWKIKSILVYN